MSWLMAVLPFERPTPWRPAVGSSDAVLWRRAADGDAQAFSTLYERHLPALLRYCRSILRDDEDAQDAVQQAMAKAFAALDKREIDVRPWLFRIAHNESISMLRRRRPTVAVPEDLSGHEDVSDVVLRRARLRDLEADLAALGTRQRAALILRELNGLGHDEIAEVLGASPRSIKQLIFEARAALHESSEGRALPCRDVERRLSDRDGRVLRGRGLRAHLRGCSSCRHVQLRLEQRPAELRALFPPLPVAAAELLADLLRGTPAASATTGGAGSAAAGGLAGAASTAATVAASTAATVAAPAGVLGAAVAGKAAVAAVLVAGGIAGGTLLAANDGPRTPPTARSAAAAGPGTVAAPTPPAPSTPSGPRAAPSPPTPASDSVGEPPNAAGTARVSSAAAARPGAPAGMPSAAGIRAGGPATSGPAGPDTPSARRERPAAEPDLPPEERARQPSRPGAQSPAPAATRDPAPQARPVPSAPAPPTHPPSPSPSPSPAGSIPPAPAPAGTAPAPAATRPIAGAPAPSPAPDTQAGPGSALPPATGSSSD